MSFNKIVNFTLYYWLFTNLVVFPFYQNKPKHKYSNALGNTKMKNILQVALFKVSS